MRDFYISELYIIRPMRLIKSREYVKLRTPYNLAAKLGLMQPDGSSFKSDSSKIIRSVYDTAIYSKKEEFQTDKSDITFATKGANLGQTVYSDVFSDQSYKLYFPAIVRKDNQILDEDLIVISQYIKSLEVMLTKLGLGHDLATKKINMSQLEKMKKVLVDKSKSKLITFKHQRPNQIYVDELLFTPFAYNKDGNRVIPQIHNSIKEKTLLKSKTRQ